MGVLAVVGILATAVPAYAADIPSTATVGGGSGAPYMIALWSTPDEVDAASDGVNVYPEPAIPNSNNGTFPNTDPTKDGWKRVNFYLMADMAQLGHDAITGMTIDVYYPSTGNSSDTNGARKFEINALKVNNAWTASQSGYAAANYPAPPGQTAVAAVPPTPPSGWNVRELNYTDNVDVNADGVLGNDSDATVGPFLTTWGTRVTYGNNPASGANWTATTAGARLQSNEALCLELVGWVWFHQPPVRYNVEGKASKGNSSPVLINHFYMVPTVNLYLDFSTINFGTFSSDVGEIFAQGDADLTTPGAPTIWDNGNIDAQVSVNASKMVLNGNMADYNNPSKTISLFDAALYYKDPAFNNVQVGYVQYGSDSAPVVISNSGTAHLPVLSVGTTGPVLLQACRPAKIDFSVLPVSGIDNGVYTGKITISLGPYTGSQAQVN